MVILCTERAERDALGISPFPAQQIRDAVLNSRGGKGLKGAFSRAVGGDGIIKGDQCLGIGVIVAVYKPSRRLGSTATDKQVVFRQKFFPCLRVLLGQQKLFRFIHTAVPPAPQFYAIAEIKIAENGSSVKLVSSEIPPYMILKSLFLYTQRAEAFWGMQKIFDLIPQMNAFHFVYIVERKTMEGMIYIESETLAYFAGGFTAHFRTEPSGLCCRCAIFGCG